MATVTHTGIVEEEAIRQILREEGYFDIFRWCDGPGSRYPVHTHPHNEVRWILSGRLWIEEEGTVLELGPGDRMESEAGVPHSAWSEEGACYLCGSKD
jgi:quercetin dioxygenase-like cupin family protein